MGKKTTWIAPGNSRSSKPERVLLSPCFEDVFDKICHVAIDLLTIRRLQSCKGMGWIVSGLKLA